MVMIPAGILNSFGITNAIYIQKFGSGLIHETFKAEGNNQIFLLQKLNHFVFKDIDGLMNNIAIVSQYIQSKFPNRININFVRPLNNSEKAYLLINGEYWRCMHFIPNSHSYEKAENLHQAYESGRVVGDFHLQVSDLNPECLIETIVNFHNFGYRLSNFEKAICEDVFDRVSISRNEIEYLLEIAKKVVQEESNNSLPCRVIHNDTKLNNILFDDEDKGMCMVDLDTLMPGNIMFDTGDALRTMCNPAGEDGRLGNIAFDKNIFVAFATGYINATKGRLSDLELKSIPFSIIRMTCEQAIRFLTDYLQGDIYYKQVFPGFNYTCTKVQIEFMRHVFNEMEWMEEKVNEIIRSSNTI